MRDKLLMHVRHTGQFCRCCDRPRPKTGIRRREKQQWISDYLDELTPNPSKKQRGKYRQLTHYQMPRWQPAGLIEAY